MPMLQADYFTAYHHVKLTRDANGVLWSISQQRRAAALSRRKLTQRLWTPSTGFRKIERTRS